MCGHLRGLVTADDRRKVAEPLQGADRGEAEFIGLERRLADHLGRSFLDVDQWHTLCPLSVLHSGVELARRHLGHVVGATADESAEQGSDDGLGDDNLVVRRSPLEVQQLHADGLVLKHTDKRVAVDAVLDDEALEDMQALGRDDVDASLLEEIGCAVSGVLDEAGVHKVLRHGLGHLAGHAERRGGRSRDDARRVSWIRPAVRLGELERSQVLRRLVSAKG